MAWFRAGGAGIPSSLKSAMNSVLNKKFGTSTTYDPAGWPDDVNLLGKLPEKTVSGAIANITDGADGVPLKELIFSASPVQASGTPSPTNPLPISGHTSLTGVHCGKNLIYPKYDGRDNAGITYTVNSDHSITCQGIATATSWAAVNLTAQPDKMQLFPAGTYTISGGLSSDVQVHVGGKTVDGDTLTGISYDSGSGATYTFTKDVYLYPQIRVASGTNLTTPVTVYIQLEVGSTKSTYAPYSAESKTWEFPPFGKNLLNIDNVYGKGYWDTDGGWHANSSYSGYKIAVQPETTYTISGNFGGVICYLDSTGTFISGTNQGAGFSKTFTTPSGCYYIERALLDSSIDGTQMLETGSQATAYEPYQSMFSGSVNALTGEVENKNKFLVLTSANASLITRTNANKYRVSQAGTGAKISGEDYTGVICNVCKPETGTTNDDRCFIRSDGVIQLNFTNSYNSVSEMLADVGDIQLCYEMEDPISIDMDSVDWQSKYADNNLYCDTGDTEVEYRADIALALGQ